jgi:Fe-S-cluster containining protein
LSNPYPIDLSWIASQAEMRQAENALFLAQARTIDEVTLDAWVEAIEPAITAGVDCTQCGNCCRSLMISVSPEERKQLSVDLQMSEAEINTRYLETSATSDYAVISRIPCHFLEGSKCSIYEYRFSDCRAFPHLDQPGFQRRLFSMMQYYGRCPMIYHTLEYLRGRMENHFNQNNPTI